MKNDIYLKLKIFKCKKIQTIHNMEQRDKVASNRSREKSYMVDCSNIAGNQMSKFYQLLKHLAGGHMGKP